MQLEIGIGESAALGVVQGLTEFLPVSSDGHLAIGAMLFGTRDMPLTMVVMLHLGTLIATLLVFGPDLWGLTKTVLGGLGRPRELLALDEGKLAVAIIAASIPTAIVGLVLEDRVESWAHVPWIVGVCLLGSAGMALLTLLGRGSEKIPTLRAAIIIGLVQGLAVLPGLTRSGSTIACAMLLGLSAPAAFRFSFLLSIPAVGGAIVLKLRDLDQVQGIGTGLAIGVLLALVTGYAALKLLQRMVSRGHFWWFALYLVPLGVGLVIWDLASGGHG